MRRRRRQEPARVIAPALVRDVGLAVCAGMQILVDPPAEALALNIEPREANVAIEYEAFGHCFKCVISYQGLA